MITKTNEGDPFVPMVVMPLPSTHQRLQAARREIGERTYVIALANACWQYHIQRMKRDTPIPTYPSGTAPIVGEHTAFSLAMRHHKL